MEPRLKPNFSVRTRNIGNGLHSAEPESTALTATNPTDSLKETKTSA